MDNTFLNEIYKNKQINETGNRSDLWAFVDGFRVLLNKHVSSVTYNGLGILTINFKSGEKIGSKRLFIEAGWNLN